MVVTSGFEQLPESADGLPGLRWILDPEPLGGLYAGSAVLRGGQNVTTSYLRYKPGLTAVARLDYQDPSGNGALNQVRWVGTYAPRVAHKVRKALSRAGELYGTMAQEMMELRDVPGAAGHLLVVGYLATDPKLVKALHTALGPSAAALGSQETPWQVLRFNPLRRVVLTSVNNTPEGARSPVVKVTAGSSPVNPTLLRAIADTGVPVQVTMKHPRLPQDPRVRCYPWFGDGDLTVERRPKTAQSAACQAGIALARMHGSLDMLAADGASPVTDFRLAGSLDPADKLATMAEDLEGLNTGVKDVFDQVAARVLSQIHTDAPAVLLHGDFSADQILVDDAKLAAYLSCDGDESGVLITDLDRMRQGVAADDLGNAVAAAVMHQMSRVPPAQRWQPHVDHVTREIVDGYRAQAQQMGRDIPTDHHIRVWAAFHLLMRVMTPFRECTPDWVQGMHRILEASGDWVPPVIPPVLEVRKPGTGVVETLTIKRAWPAADGRLSAELVDAQGRVRAARRQADEHALSVPRWEVQDFGVDPALSALEHLTPHGRLVVHRLARRAVVALPDRYVKVVAGGKAAQVARLSRELHRIGTNAGFAVPRVMDVHVDRLEFSVVSGRSLHHCGMHGEHATYAAGIQGWAMRWPQVVQAQVQPGELPEYTAEDEVRTLAGWVRRSRAFPGVLGMPDHQWTRVVDVISERLLGLASGGTVSTDGSGGWVPGVVHRDLHEKQLLVTPSADTVGLLDFDTAAVGDPALDLANLGVHLDLHRAQGVLADDLHRVASETVGDVAEALGVTQQRLSVYRAATRARLVCVYAFRPQWQGLAQSWAQELRAELLP